MFSESEKQAIVAAIRQAEKATSGEIRVHVQPKCSEDPMQDAIAVFHRLKMTETAARNGVLVFLATEHRKFAVVGDEGIHRFVGNDFWNETAQVMRQHFSGNEMVQGLCAAILLIGEKLKLHFPYQQQDTNELSDEISEGE
ncbi:MAG: TPM domain-containing protein [Chitinophagales bacterium]